MSKKPIHPNSIEGRKVMAYISRRLLANVPEEQIEYEIGRQFGIPARDYRVARPEFPEGLISLDLLEAPTPTRDELQRFAEALEADLAAG